MLVINLVLDSGGSVRGRWFCSWRKPASNCWIWRSSWNVHVERPGCWEEHHPGQWWPHWAACSTPRHYGLRAADDVDWFWSSCCHERHFQPTLGSLQLNTPLPPPSKPELQYPPARRSCPFRESSGFDACGIVVRPWKTESWASKRFSAGDRHEYLRDNSRGYLWRSEGSVKMRKATNHVASRMDAPREWHSGSGTGTEARWTPASVIYKEIIWMCLSKNTSVPLTVCACALTEKNCSISYCTFPNVLFLLPRFRGLYLCQFHAGPYVTGPVYISCRQAEYCCLLCNLVKQFKQNTER